MSKIRREPAVGPFRADQLREGDRYELSNGHPLYCAPARREHAAPNLIGAAVIDSDPAVEWAGVDAGFTPAPGTLRAPDVAVAAPAGADADGWIPGAPPLAIEYAGRGQDQADLKVKIAELLAAGTRYVWVVRVQGPRRVEVHEAGQPPRLVGAGEVLAAPGILRNPIPVEALYDRAAGHRATLRNLLQREGYDSLEAVRTEGHNEGRKEGHKEGRKEGHKEGRKEGRQEGREEGMAEAILALLQGRGIPVDAPIETRVRACREHDTLHRWLLRAASIERGEQLFDAP